MTLGVLFFFGIVIIIIGLVVLYSLYRQEKQLGSLGLDIVYKDSQTIPSLILEASSLPLRGKPDAIQKENYSYIPVEIKTGKTPREPYMNHTMQLMAYCLLVHEYYGIRPLGGIIKYPEKEFKVAYTQEAEEALRAVVSEILQAKQSGKEFTCSHPEHQQKLP